MDNPINRAEHNEFARRMEDEHKRISRRLTRLESQTEQLNSLALSVRELATSLQNMVVEQQEQSARLAKLENKDGEMWRKVISHAITVLVGMAITVLINGVMG